MMRLGTFVVLAGTVLGTSLRAEDKEAVAVIKKAMEAHGGMDLLKKYVSSDSEVSGTLNVMNMELQISGTVSSAVPGKLRVDLSMNIMDQKIRVVQIVNGSKVKMTAAGMEIPLPDSVREDMIAGNVGQEIGQFFPLLDAKRFTLKSMGEVEIAGSKAAIISAKGPAVNDKEWKLFFDKKSGLMVKTQRTSKSEDGSSDVDEETFQEEFKKVDGVMVATKVVVKHDGKPFMSMTFNSVKVSEKVDEKKFDVAD